MFTTPRKHSKIQDNHIQIIHLNIHHHIQIVNTKNQSAHSAQNLEIFLDENMAVTAQVKKIYQSTYFQIRNINSMRKILSDDTASILVHALITSRLDNGNALLYWISNTLLDKLQLIQNAAARVLSKTHKYDHITPTHIHLHWLPIHQRIQFQILLLTWKTLNRLALSYISQLLTHVPTRTLRCWTNFFFQSPKHYLCMVIQQFVHADPYYGTLFQWTLIVVLLSLHLKIVLKHMCSNLRICCNQPKWVWSHTNKHFSFLYSCIGHF